MFLLALEEPHDPAGDEDSADEPGEAVEAIVDHASGFVALRDAEDNGGADRKDESGGEVREVEVHCFFPMAMWYASMAAMKLSRPPQTRNLVP